MKLTLSATTFAAFVLLLDNTDQANAKRLAEPMPPFTTEDSPHKPRALSVVSISDVPNTRDEGIQKEKNKRLPPVGPDTGFADDGIEVTDNNQDFNTHIVGGTQADLGEYPYFVDMNVIGCGGALIAPQVVLSAAHCGDEGVNYVNQRVIVGAYQNGSSSTTGASSVRVTAQRNHPNFDDDTMENDFMLLKLETAVSIATPRLSIASSGGSSNPSAGTSLTVIGLGDTSDGGSSASRLREVVVPVVDANECDDLYGGIATDVMFCAGTCRCCYDRLACQLRDCFRSLFLSRCPHHGFCICITSVISFPPPYHHKVTCRTEASILVREIREGLLSSRNPPPSMFTLGSFRGETVVPCRAILVSMPMSVPCSHGSSPSCATNGD